MYCFSIFAAVRFKATTCKGSPLVETLDLRTCSRRPGGAVVEEEADICDEEGVVGGLDACCGGGAGAGGGVVEAMTGRSSRMEAVLTAGAIADASCCCGLCGCVRMYVLYYDDEYSEYICVARGSGHLTCC